MLTCRHVDVNMYVCFGALELYYGDIHTTVCLRRLVDHVPQYNNIIPTIY